MYRLTQASCSSSAGRAVRLARAYAPSFSSSSPSSSPSVAATTAAPAACTAKSKAGVTISTTELLCTDELPWYAALACYDFLRSTEATQGSVSSSFSRPSSSSSSSLSSAFPAIVADETIWYLYRKMIHAHCGTHDCEPSALRKDFEESAAMRMKHMTRSGKNDDKVASISRGASRSSEEDCSSVARSFLLSALVSQPSLSDLARAFHGTAAAAVALNQEGPHKGGENSACLSSCKTSFSIDKAQLEQLLSNPCVVLNASLTHRLRGLASEPTAPDRCGGAGSTCEAALRTVSFCLERESTMRSYLSELTAARRHLLTLALSASHAMAASSSCMDATHVGRLDLLKWLQLPPDMEKLPQGQQQECLLSCCAHGEATAAKTLIQFLEAPNMTALLTSLQWKWEVWYEQRVGRHLTDYGSAATQALDPRVVETIAKSSLSSSRTTPDAHTTTGMASDAREAEEAAVLSMVRTLDPAASSTRVVTEGIMSVDSTAALPQHMLEQWSRLTLAFTVALHTCRCVPGPLSRSTRRGTGLLAGSRRRDTAEGEAAEDNMDDDCMRRFTRANAMELEAIHVLLESSTRVSSFPYISRLVESILTALEQARKAELHGGGGAATGTATTLTNREEEENKNSFAPTEGLKELFMSLLLVIARGLERAPDSTTALTFLSASWCRLNATLGWGDTASRTSSSYEGDARLLMWPEVVRSLTAQEEVSGSFMSWWRLQQQLQRQPEQQQCTEVGKWEHLLLSPPVSTSSLVDLSTTASSEKCFAWMLANSVYELRVMSASVVCLVQRTLKLKPSEHKDVIAATTLLGTFTGTAWRRLWDDVDRAIHEDRRAEKECATEKQDRSCLGEEERLTSACRRNAVLKACVRQLVCQEYRHVLRVHSSCLYVHLLAEVLAHAGTGSIRAALLSALFGEDDTVLNVSSHHGRETKVGESSVPDALVMNASGEKEEDMASDVAHSSAVLSLDGLINSSQSGTVCVTTTETSALLLSRVLVSWVEAGRLGDAAQLLEDAQGLLSNMPASLSSRSTTGSATKGSPLFQSTSCCASSSSSSFPHCSSWGMSERCNHPVVREFCHAVEKAGKAMEATSASSRPSSPVATEHNDAASVEWMRLLAHMPAGCLTEVELVVWLYWMMRACALASSSSSSFLPPDMHCCAISPSSATVVLGKQYAHTDLILAMASNVKAHFGVACNRYSVAPPMLLNWLVAQTPLSWREAVQLLLSESRAAAAATAAQPPSTPSATCTSSCTQQQSFVFLSLPLDGVHSHTHALRLLASLRLAEEDILLLSSDVNASSSSSETLHADDVDISTLYTHVRHVLLHVWYTRSLDAVLAYYTTHHVACGVSFSNDRDHSTLFTNEAAAGTECYDASDGGDVLAALKRAGSEELRGALSGSLRPLMGSSHDATALHEAQNHTSSTVPVYALLLLVLQERHLRYSSDDSATNIDTIITSSTTAATDMVTVLTTMWSLDASSTLKNKPPAATPPSRNVLALQQQRRLNHWRRRVGLSFLGAEYFLPSRVKGKTEGHFGNASDGYAVEAEARALPHAGLMMTYLSLVDALLAHDTSLSCVPRLEARMLAAVRNMIVEQLDHLQSDLPQPKASTAQQDNNATVSTTSVLLDVCKKIDALLLYRRG